MLKLKKLLAIVLVLIVLLSATGMIAMQYEDADVDVNNLTAIKADSMLSIDEESNHYTPDNGELPYYLCVAERSAVLNRAISDMCTHIPSMLGLTESVGAMSFINDEQWGATHQWNVGFDAWIAKTTEIWEVRIDETDGITYLFNPAAGYLIYSTWEQTENGELVEVDIYESARQLNNQLFDFVKLVEEIGCECDYVNLEKPLFEADTSESNAMRNVTFHYVETGRTETSTLTGTPVTNTVPGPYTFRTVAQIRVNEFIPPEVTVQGTAGVNAVRNGAGFNWVQSAMTSSTPGGAMTIPAGRHGHIRADAAFNVTIGTLVVREGSMTHNIPVRAQSPQLVGSHARAFFRVVLL